MRCPSCGTEYEATAKYCIRDGSVLQTQSATTALHRTIQVPSPRGILTDPAAELAGKVLERRYRIETRVGQGGMAHVYRARDETTGGLVAVKVLMSHLTGDGESALRLRREAEYVMRLHHPSICPILGFGQDFGLAYLVMAFLDGETLTNRESQQGPLSLQSAMPIMLDLCAGLQHAHDAGILHRDLKPENVMLVKGPGGQERAVLTDFGLAKQHIAGPAVMKLTATGIVVGTPEFMSPEQIRGRAVDHRSDIYSLGVLLFELLSGQLPFAGTTAQEMMINHLTSRPLSLGSVRADIPPAVDAAVARAVANRPDDRYASMSAFGGALQAAAR